VEQGSIMMLTSTSIAAAVWRSGCDVHMTPNSDRHFVCHFSCCPALQCVYLQVIKGRRQILQYKMQAVLPHQGKRIATLSPI
jgi:hypothetical protein